MPGRNGTPDQAISLSNPGVVPGETLILNPPAGLTDRTLVRVKGT